MKKDEVPQDNSLLLEGNTREICYAVDENGRYVKMLSTGWDPKDIALRQALEFIEKRANEAKEKIANNQLSPIAYYLEKRMMDIKLLSQYTDILRWRVKRHLKPNVFKKLSHEILKKYADAFEITVDELLNF
ncbi:MAG: helix-turn-helix domain-containing protein [Ignavibacteriaceae bacterium]